jgi:WD40 repeat protein
LSSVALSPDGRTLASADTDGMLRLWDATNPTAPGPLGPPLNGETGPVRSVVFSPDGQTLASGASGDGAIRLWAVR